MDEVTLLTYRDLWVPEPKAAAGTYPSLTVGEQAVLERIRSEGNVRLEQERIPWGVALERLVETLELGLGPAADISGFHLESR
jgi:hypothetical protein